MLAVSEAPEAGRAELDKEALRVALDRSPAARQLCKSQPNIERAQPQRVIFLAAHDRNTVLAPDEREVIVGYLQARGLRTPNAPKELCMDYKTERLISQALFKPRKRR